MVCLKLSVTCLKSAHEWSLGSCHSLGSWLSHEKFREVCRPHNNEILVIAIHRSRRGRLVGVEENGGVYLCPTCSHKADQDPVGKIGRLHSTDKTSRLRICLSSSMLHEQWMECNYKGDEEHVDWVTSPGATVQTLHTMWYTDYTNENRDMDILLVASLDNFGTESINEIMENIQNFNSTVKTQSLQYHPTWPSTFRVATILHAPKFYWVETKDDPAQQRNHEVQQRAFP